MATRERAYTVDEVWRLANAPENEQNRYTLIDGELTVKMSPGYLRARIASEIARLMGNFVTERDLGEVTVESGHYPQQDRRTLQLPDVAFISKERAPASDWDRYVPIMPDLAVEMISPSQSMKQAREKAATYLRHGTAIVWLVHPTKQRAEIWTAADDGTAQSQTIDADGALTGGAVRPAFSLPLRQLFQPRR